MSDHLKISDDILFDRLVDGELSVSARRELLESLDARPEGWRRCALAFLEAQSWRNDLRDMMRESDASNSRVTPLQASHRFAAFSARRIAAWTVIAAGMLVAYSLGFLQRSERGGPGVSVEPQSSGLVAEAPAETSPSNPRSDPDTLTLWVQDESGRPRSVRVPLREASDLDRLGVQFQPGLPAELRSQLQDGGYQVHSKRRYAPIWLENGQQMVLPVEDTKIVPVSQNVY